MIRPHRRLTDDAAESSPENRPVEQRVSVGTVDGIGNYIHLGDLPFFDAAMDGDSQPASLFRLRMRAGTRTCLIRSRGSCLRLARWFCGCAQPEHDW